MLKKQYYKMDAIYYSKLIHELEKGIQNIFLQYLTTLNYKYSIEFNDCCKIYPNFDLDPIVQAHNRKQRHKCISKLGHFGFVFFLKSF